MRWCYMAHLMAITTGAPQLLVCFEYDQSLMAGPPFSIAGEEVIRHYREAYEVTLLDPAPTSPAGSGASCLRRRPSGGRWSGRWRRGR